MLSLGSNISATQAVESKYSGVFDGTDDFVDCGLIDFNTNDFSVSCWVKLREWTQYSTIWSNRSDSSNSNIGVGLRTTGVTGELQLFSDWGTPTDSSIVTGVPADTWVHVVCTGDRDGNQVIYLNDDDATTTTDISDRSSVDFTSNLEFRIGRSHGDLYHNMSISQLGIWNVALSANAVEALYNNGKPINLRINQGNYTSSSNLQQYYKFGNGLFDDKAIGIVHDQDNPGFGSNLVTNGHFDVNTSGWSAGSGRYIHSLTWEKDCLYFCSVDLYLVSGKFRIDGADTAVIGAGTGSNSEIIGIETYDAAIDDRWRTVTGYAIGVASGNTDELWIRSFGTSSGKSITQGTFGGRRGVARFVFTDTGEFYIDNVSVKKINGKPGLTSGGVTFSSDTP